MACARDPMELGNCYPTVSSNFRIGRLLAHPRVKSWPHCQPQETAASTAGIGQAFVKVEVQQCVLKRRSSEKVPNTPATGS